MKRIFVIDDDAAIELLYTGELFDPDPLEEKGIISGKNAQTTVLETAVHLGMHFHK